jgi:hypothetical protein
MRQPVIPVIHAVNAAFHNFVAATKLLRFLCHIVLRCNQTHFPLTSAHEPDPSQPPDWMLLIDCEVVLTTGVFCGIKNDLNKPACSHQLLSIQLIRSDASSKIPTIDCMKEQRI